MEIKASSRTACVVTGACLFLIAGSRFTHAQNQASQPTLEQQLKETEAGFRKSDAAMNELYQKILSSLPPNGQEEFKNAQRAWVKSRDHSAAIDKADRFPRSPQFDRVSVKGLHCRLLPI